MKYGVLQQAADYSKVRKRKKRWHKVVTCLAALVVFCTAYALILPAITQERPMFCGLEEHTHSEACWQSATVTLSCNPTMHLHSDACYDDFGSLLCGYSDVILHTHNQDCYDEQGSLRCSFDEVFLHSHDESCYAEPELMCMLEESLEHQHEAECYADPTSICHMQQIVLHAHDESCRDESGNLICMMPEVSEHVHSQMCFATTESLLICALHEHSHNDYCYIDKNADVETAAIWEATLPQELSGQWSVDSLAVAISQLGYQESESNVVINDDGVVRGYTRYGEWYGDHYGDWCAMFASFCLNYAQANNEFIPFEANCQSWVEKLTEQELYSSAAGHIVKSGDLIFFDCETDGFADHVGLVVELIPADEENPARIKTIEGNRNNCVQFGEYLVTDETILGYGDVDAAQENYELTVPHDKIYSDDSVVVQATYFSSAQIPDDAELSITWIDPETSAEAYENCYLEAQELLGLSDTDVTEIKITDFKLYDICFIHMGEEIEPADTVDIKISIPETNLTETESVTVIHYEDEGAHVPEEQEYALDEAGVLNTAFETDSFSLFAIVTTETSTNSIISFSKYDVTTTNIRALNGTTFAIASGNYALTLNDANTLAVKALQMQENSKLTGDESLVRWVFERNNNSNYYISTVQDEITYYLDLNNGALSLVSDRGQATVFTASRSNTDLTLRSGGTYINITETGVSAGNSAVLSLYIIPNGPFTVTFDGQLGLPQYYDSSNRKFTGAEKVQKQTDSDGYITLPTVAETAVPGNYPMRLNGWYDIINKIYYDSSMLGQKIRVTNDTIFYAEWVAATYDIGQDVDVVAGQPDTSDFINTYVYDYNELFNLHSANYSESSGTWTFDPDSELGFIFFDYLTGGNIGNISSKDVAVDGVTVNQEKTNGTRGSSTNFPGTITSGIANDARLNALFGSQPVAGRLALGEADWLYSYDNETGFYYYNSAKNAASYNQSAQRFYVYDYVVNIDSQNSLHDFLPFNYGQIEYAEKDNEANYWFGMKSEIKFYLPDDSGSGNNQSAHGTDMQLRFSGDDDVWVYIDGQLVLDLGGVHDVVYGEVNFSTGKVTIGQAISSSAIADNTADSYAGMPGVTLGTAGVTTTDLPMIIKGGEKHTITIYYLERGSSLSNCAIYFNLSPAYELQITKQDTNRIDMLAGAVFQVFDDEECTIPSKLYLIEENGTRVESVDAKFTTDEDGILRCWGLLAGRTYYVKEIEPPDGYPLLADYVIEVVLNVDGDAVITTLDNTLDSNGNQWSFADSYVRVSDTEHLIGIDVFNDKYIGVDKDTGVEKRLYVEKVWAEGSEDIPQEITVRLYANGEATNRTLVLNSANDWKAIFYLLPATDDDGVEIEYTIVEENIPEGYKVSYEEIIGSESTTTITPADWETVSSLVDGETYRFVANSYAVQGSNGATLNAATPSETDEAQCWIATAYNGGFLLQNKAYPSRYLTITTSSASGSTSTSGNSVTIKLNGGRLQSNSNGYLRVQSSGVSATRRSNYASTFTVYRLKQEVSNTVSTPVPGWRVTNTPLPDTISIPVQKLWDDTVSEANKKEISVSLYLVNEREGAEAQLQSSITLNAENQWKSSFDDLPLAPEGSFYCIIENTSEYKVTYGGETVSVFVNGELCEAVRVTLDENGQAVQVDVTNSVLVLLPNTGGAGMQWYTLGGLLLIVASILLLYRHQKRRKEDFASS